MCAKVLPQDFKQVVTEKVKKFIEKYPDNVKVNELQNVINFMNSEDHSEKFGALNKYINAVDRMRNTSFAEAFPELQEMWNRDGI
jgi:hypothetical protein